MVANHNLELVEAARARFRPDKIMTLFVGESAPDSAKFFYFDGKTPMRTHTQKAIEQALGADGADIRDRFKALGWYLDDLSLAPVDNLPKKERVAACRDARQTLADRIKLYQPQAIVTVVKSVAGDVAAAAIAAGYGDVPQFSLPFPGRYHQNKFVSGLAAIISHLPRL
jgi:hypothetical protein